MTQHPDEPRNEPPPPPGPQQPGPQQYAGYQPYGAPQPGPGGYGGYPASYTPPSSGGSGKTIAIIVGAIVLVVLLFCGGIIAAVVMLINSVEDQIDDFDPDRPGGRSNPLVVDVGEEFEIDGITYADGWTIGSDETYDKNIVDLKATNDREDEQSDYVTLNFTFLDADDVELAEISCHSDGRIGAGHSERLECLGTDRLPSAYDRIEVGEG